MHAPESVRSDAAFPPNSISDDTLVDSSSSTCSDVVFSNKMSSESAHSPIKGAYIHESKVSEDVVGASDCTLVDISVPDSRDSSLPPSSPNIWPSSSLPPISHEASPEVDPDFSKDSATPGSDCILVLDHDFYSSTDDRSRIDLGIKAI